MAKGKKREKGAYRALYEALPDDPDFQDLSGVARAVFYPLRLKLGQAAIGVFYLDALPRLTGFPIEQTDAGMEELERGDWIRRERNIVWIRNGVRHDPMEPLASPNGRKGIEHFLRSLPKLQIVNDFARYYSLAIPYPGVDIGAPPPIAPTEAPTGGPSEAPAPAHPEGVGQHGVRSTEYGEEQKQHSVTDVTEPGARAKTTNGKRRRRGGKGNRTPEETAVMAAIAPAVRKHFWIGGKPPRARTPDGSHNWDEGNEITAAFQILEREKGRTSIEDLVGAIEVGRAVMGFDRDVPLTLKIFNDEAHPERLFDCVSYWRSRELRKASGSTMRRLGELGGERA